MEALCNNHLLGNDDGIFLHELISKVNAIQIGIKYCIYTHTLLLYCMLSRHERKITKMK